MKCIKCNSEHVHKDGNHNGNQRYRCLDCGKTFDCGIYEKNYIIHFKTKLKKTERNFLTRENYCVPTSKDKMYYTASGIKRHYNKCMKNFDLNMEYFSSISNNEFNTYLTNFVKTNNFIEISDLNDVNKVRGIYILVLDNYKQVYIGKSEGKDGIKKRIIGHWNRKKDFSRLIYGDVNTSVLSIDSFGALDTTRIFYKEMKDRENVDRYEAKVVKKFKREYRLNRVAGGINAENNFLIRNIKLLFSAQKRDLK